MYMCIYLYVYVYVYVYVIHVLVHMLNHNLYNICKMYTSYMYSFWLKQGQTRVFFTTQLFW